MQIAGFQRLSLLDYPGVIASIVFTQGCAFRCGYCHNPELIPIRGSVSAIPEDDIIAKLDENKKFVEGVVITGGEPTMQEDLDSFIRRIKSLGFLVKLDTNGMHPEVVQRLVDGKLLNYIAMDIKNVWERYEQVTRVRNPLLIDRCRQTLALIQQSGVAHEFRTTLYPGVHTEDDVIAMAGMLAPGERYFLQRFRPGKTLVSGIPEKVEFDEAALVNKILKMYPQIEVRIR